MCVDEQQFAKFFSDNGYFVVENMISAERVRRAKTDLQMAIAAERDLRALRADVDPLQVVFCPYYSNSFLEILQYDVLDKVEILLGKESILYSYNNSSMPPGNGNFSSRIHRERHYDTGFYLESLGVLVLLDDFTAENGATWFLPGSHRHDDLPQPASFYDTAVRLLHPAGSVFYFHPRLVHTGDLNHSGAQRDALAIGFCKPYLKQRLNMVEVLGNRMDTIKDERILQKLGGRAQPPNSIAEFYSRTVLPG